MHTTSHLVRVAQAGKDADPGWYRVHRRLSIHVTALALRWGVRATSVSLAMSAVMAVGALGVAAPTRAANVAGFVLCYAAFLLDKVDGEIARCRGEASARGVLLDRFFHRVVEPLLFVAVGVHAARGAGGVLALVAGFVVALLANAIEETQQLPPFILYKRACEGAATPTGSAPALDPGLARAARWLRPLKAFRMPITALPLFALCFLAEGATGAPVTAWALAVAAVALAAYLLFQTALYYHGRLDAELVRVATTLRDARPAPPPSSPQGD